MNEDPLAQALGALMIVAIIGAGTVITLKSLPRLTALPSGATSRRGAWLFLLWYAVTFIVSIAGSRALGIAGDEGTEPSLEQLMTLTALANLAAVFAVLIVAALQDGGLRKLGFWRRAGAVVTASRPSGLVVGVAMWFAFIPAFGLVAWANDALLTTLDVPTDLQLQLAMFTDDPTARSSPWVWLSIGLITPVCEEIGFRGLLFGGLRRALPPGLAMLASAVIFGLLHERAVALPVVFLGLLLAWSYERSGSLLVPCVIHALHNSATLAIVTTLPA